MQKDGLSAHILPTSATLVGACTEQPSAPKVNRETIAADFTNNANGGGPNMLYRGTDGYSLVLNDGHYVVAFFPSPLIRCGHQFPIANEVAQYNGDLPGFFRLVVLGKQMNVYVLDLTEPTTCTVPSGSGAFVGWSEAPG